MPSGMEVCLSPDDIVLDGDAASLPKKGTKPPTQFSAHVYCDQTAGWIKKALGMEVGLGPCHIVLDGDPAALPKKGSRAPIFGPFYRGQTAGCIKNRCHLVWRYRGRSQPRRLCVRWGPSYPQKKGIPTSTQFLAHVYCGQTAG